MLLKQICHRTNIATILLAVLIFAQFNPTRASAQTFILRVMAANLNGNSQTYEPSELRILQGLKPDVVAIQEFNYLGNTAADFRSMMDTTFGTDFNFYRESGFSIPNGIISRYPILASGSWNDVEQSAPNRGFAWARIDVPGTNDLYVVSVHLLSGAGSAARAREAANLLTLIQANFPTNAWIIVAGDMNTDARSEGAITTFKTFLSDTPIPTDATSGGNPNTNEPRSKPYDYVLPSFSLAALQTNLDIGSQSFPNGLVFDSRTFIQLGDVAPVQAADSGNGQHMAILKAFVLNGIDTRTNPPVGQLPAIITPPASLVVNTGAPATFLVVATGDAPLLYQWTFNGTALTSATNSSFTVTSSQSTNIGIYAVRVSNPLGTATSTGASLGLAIPTTGQILAQWNFNFTNTSLTSPPPSQGAGQASLIGITTPAWAAGSPTDPSPTNSAWNTAPYPAQSSGNKTVGVQFRVSTVGHRNISLRWDLRGSNTANKYTRLLYSTNGITFLEFPSAMKLTTPAIFESFTNSLASLPGVDNNPDFAFRVVSEFESTSGFGTFNGYVGVGGTYGTGGTLRYDLVTVLGIPLDVTPTLPATLDASRQTNGFSVRVSGTPGIRYSFEQRTSLGLSNWIPLVTNTSPFVYSETNQPVSGPRFFRAVGPR